MCSFYPMGFVGYAHFVPIIISQLSLFKDLLFRSLVGTTEILNLLKTTNLNRVFMTVLSGLSTVLKLMLYHYRQNHEPILYKPLFPEYVHFILSCLFILSRT